MTEMRLDEETFAQVVKSTPLVSIDLVLRNRRGEVLLGMRRNRPAKDFWFLPGSRILKGEPVRRAFRRITKAELGTEIPFEQSRFLGVFDHFYDEAFSERVDAGTQYVAIAFEVDEALDAQMLPHDQHSEYKWFTREALLTSNTVHQNVKAMFETPPLASTTDLISLYAVYQEATSYYTNIVWAFPTALIAMNVLAIQALQGSIVHFALAVFDVVFLQAFFKLVENQRAILKSIQETERVLRQRFAYGAATSLVPVFKYRWPLTYKSANLLKWGLASAWSLFFAWSGYNFARTVGTLLGSWVSQHVGRSV